MKYQSLFSEEKYITKCRLLKFIPSMLSVNKVKINGDPKSYFKNKETGRDLS